ncbi:MAG: DUF599 domain-containing protein [Gammaproteobacteria bacterium]|nr:DUF599 domain-containing protein [Gammaproteobacteria bacterium]
MQAICAAMHAEKKNRRQAGSYSALGPWLSWFLDPRAFMAASAVVLIILVNRDFRTRSITSI